MHASLACWHGMLMWTYDLLFWLTLCQFKLFKLKVLVTLAKLLFWRGMLTCNFDLSLTETIWQYKVVLSCGIVYWIKKCYWSNYICRFLLTMMLQSMLFNSKVLVHLIRHRWMTQYMTQYSSMYGKVQSHSHSTFNQCLYCTCQSLQLSYCTRRAA